MRIKGKVGVNVDLQKLPSLLAGQIYSLWPVSPPGLGTNSGIQLLFQVFKCYQPLECSVIPTAHVSYLMPYNFQDYSLFPISIHFGQWVLGATWIPQGCLGTWIPSLTCLSFLPSCLQSTDLVCVRMASRL